MIVKQDLVPCILVTFDKEQIVVWRGKDYKPTQEGFFLTERESFDDQPNDMSDSSYGIDKTDNPHSIQYFASPDDDE